MPFPIDGSGSDGMRSWPVLVRMTWHGGQKEVRRVTAFFLLDDKRQIVPWTSFATPFVLSVRLLMSLYLALSHPLLFSNLSRPLLFSSLSHPPIFFIFASLVLLLSCLFRWIMVYVTELEEEERMMVDDDDEDDMDTDVAPARKDALEGTRSPAVHKNELVSKVLCLNNHLTIAM